jgi:hypothetical protein
MVEVLVLVSVVRLALVGGDEELRWNFEIKVFAVFKLMLGSNFIPR